MNRKTVNRNKATGKVKQAVVILVAPLVAMLTTLSPVAASTETSVTVLNGTLTITGTDAGETISVNRDGGDGTRFRVQFTDGDGIAETHTVDGVTRNVIIEAGGGLDQVHIGTDNPTTFPGSLTIRSDHGPNTTVIANVEIDGDLTLSGGGNTRVFRTSIGDDLMGTSGPAVMKTTVIDSEINDLFQVRATSGGQIVVLATESEARRTRITGGGKGDRVELTTNDLGASPNINLGGDGDVFILLADNAWTGNAPFNLGGGDDQVLVDDLIDDGQPVEEVRLGRMNLRLGSGDDIASVRTPLTVAGTVLDGQGGNDTLRAGGLQDDPTWRATNRNFEAIEGGAPPPPIDVDVTSAGDLRVTAGSSVTDILIEHASTTNGYTVNYVTDGVAGSSSIDVAGVTRHVFVEVAKATVSFGRVTGDTEFPRNVTVNAAPGGEMVVTFDRVTIGGNVRVNAKAVTEVEVRESTVDGTFDVRAHPQSTLALLAMQSSFGRTKVVGSMQEDFVTVLASTDLGSAPNLNLGSGGDSVSISDGSWTGRLSLITGAGDDVVNLFGDDIGRLRAVMGGGHDVLFVEHLANNGSGSILQGDAGDDHLYWAFEPTAATVRTFEVAQQGV